MDPCIATSRCNFKVGTKTEIMALQLSFVNTFCFNHVRPDQWMDHVNYNTKVYLWDWKYTYMYRPIRC